MKTFVVADTQVIEGVSLDHIKAAGQYIVKERPEEIVIIGDWFDFESLSYYASPKEKEGRRLSKDIEAGKEALLELLYPMWSLQLKQKLNKKKVYKPKIVFTAGNHEERINTYLKKNPELEGSLPCIKTIVGNAGIEYHPFLEAYVGINNVHYFHYLAAPMSGKAIGGSIDNKLNKVTYSFVMGHQQHFQYGERQQVTGNPQFGVVAGAFYEHDESYKGVQGNTHTRGTVILHHHDKGTDIEFISCERLKREYL